MNNLRAFISEKVQVNWNVSLNAIVYDIYEIEIFFFMKINITMNNSGKKVSDSL